MLFQMKSFDDPINWAEIYLIICVSASVIEEIRKVSEDSFNQAGNITLVDTLASRWLSHTHVGTMAQVWFMDSHFIYIALRSLLHRYWLALWRNDSTWVVHCSQVSKIIHSPKSSFICELDKELYWLLISKYGICSHYDLLAPLNY